MQGKKAKASKVGSGAGVKRSKTKKAGATKARPAKARTKRAAATKTTRRVAAKTTANTQATTKRKKVQRPTTAPKPRARAKASTKPAISRGGNQPTLRRKSQTATRENVATNIENAPTTSTQTVDALDIAAEPLKEVVESPRDRARGSTRSRRCSCSSSISEAFEVRSVDTRCVATKHLRQHSWGETFCTCAQMSRFAAR